MKGYDMATATYEVIEFNPETGTLEGVQLQTALGPMTRMTSADLISHWPEVRELGRAFFIELEACYGTAH